MSESERRRGYRYNRVLIETARILDPQFADAVVFLSGAQIEMLRNVTQYLNRLETYVTEYNPGYYLAPTVTDYDDILEIVADLEETLMGNPNTIWGYHDRWMEPQDTISVGNYSTYADTDPVPEGYVHIFEHWDIRHNHGSTRAVVLTIVTGDGQTTMWEAPAVPHWEMFYGDTHITLKEGDYVRAQIIELLTGRTIELTVSGYKMKVPVE